MRHSDAKIFELERQVKVLFAENRELRTRVGKLENNFGRVNQFNKPVAERLDNLSKSIKRLESEVEDRSGYLTLYAWGSANQETKQFTLREKVDAIMEHLNLAELAHQDNKLITAPKKKASK